MKNGRRERQFRGSKNIPKVDGYPRVTHLNYLIKILRLWKIKLRCFETFTPPWIQAAVLLLTPKFSFRERRLKQECNPCLKGALLLVKIRRISTRRISPKCLNRLNVTYVSICFLTTMAHTLDSVLGYRSPPSDRYHHIFIILRSMVPFKKRIRSRRK